MPTKMPDGAGRLDDASYSPENLIKLRLGRNLSRAAKLPAGLTLAEMLQSEEILESLEIPALASTIAKDGQLQNVLVRRLNDGVGELVMGFRRTLAVGLINLDPDRFGAKGPMPLKASITKCTDDELLHLNLVENLHRKGLGPMDLAFVARDATEHLGWSQARVAEELGLSASTVSLMLSWIPLPKRTRDAIDKGRIPPSLAARFKGMGEEQVLALTDEVLAGVKPASIAKRLTEQKRDAGEARPRSLSEIKKALAEHGTDQAEILYRWICGDPGVSLEDARLEDFPAKTVKELQREARKAEREAAQIVEVG